MVLWYECVMVSLNPSCALLSRCDDGRLYMHHTHKHTHTHACSLRTICSMLHSLSPVRTGRRQSRFRHTGPSPHPPHTCTHARTHARTHTHMHTCIHLRHCALPLTSDGVRIYGYRAGNARRKGRTADCRRLRCLRRNRSTLADAFTFRPYGVGLNAHTHTHARTHARTRARTHTHAHTHSKPAGPSSACVCRGT